MSLPIRKHDLSRAAKREIVLTGVTGGHLSLGFGVRSEIMNVQSVNALLPSAGGQPLGPLLSSAFRLDHAVPSDMERLLTLADQQPSVRRDDRQ
jgi:hypothetical protein